jgi:hypothetical protein
MHGSLGCCDKKHDEDDFSDTDMGAQRFLRMGEREDRIDEAEYNCGLRPTVRIVTSALSAFRDAGCQPPSYRTRI